MNPKSEFSLILHANQHAQHLSQISFLIKLTSLNALLLALRSDSSMQGYIVVTEELIRYSDSLRNFAESLQAEIFQKVENLSTQLKDEVLARLLKKTNSMEVNGHKLDHMIISRLIQEFNMKSTLFVNKIKSINDNIEKIMNQNSQFVTKGKMLSLHSRIESTNSAKLKESFSHVASDLEQQTGKLKGILNDIQKVLKLNIATLENKIMKAGSAA